MYPVVSMKLNKIGAALAVSVALSASFAAAALAQAPAETSPAPVAKPAVPAKTPTLDAVMFLREPDTLYVALPELGEALGIPVRTTPQGAVYLKDQKVPNAEQRALPDGTPLARLRALQELGLTVGWNDEKKMAEVRAGNVAAWIRRDRRVVVDGITFANEPGAVYAPARDLSRALAWPELTRKAGKVEKLDGEKAPDEPVRELFDGTTVVAVDVVSHLDTTASCDTAPEGARVQRGDREVWVRQGEKRVAVNRKLQRLRAWEGDILVMDTKISTGKTGMETPLGFYKAGPIKGRLLISKKYNNAEMPWAVQLRGSYLIHGSESVPSYPASHGCVRMPLSGRNAARWFYNWITIGTPIRIADGWPKPAEPEDEKRAGR